MLNNCTFIGRLGKDLELKYTPGGKPVLNFSLAVQRDLPDQNNNRVTDFFNFVAWNKAAESMANNLSKGDLIAVETRAQTRQYEHQGRTNYVTEFLVIGFPKFLKVKKWENGGNGNNMNAGNSQPATQAHNQQQNYTRTDDDPFAANGGYPEVSDDDLPF